MDFGFWENLVRRSCQLVAMDLSFMLRTCYRFVSDTTGKSPTYYRLATEKLV